jgi:Tol biopolymer transport system component
MALCVDKVGLPTAQFPLQVTSPFVTQLTLPLDERADILSLSAIPVSPDDQMATDIDGMRWWPPNPGEQFDLPLEAPHELELSLAPGLYVLSVFAQWQDIGDVNYGFLVEVLPSEDSDASDGEDAVSAVVILAEAGLNLRAEPDSASEVIGILPQNELVDVTGASPDGGWWQVACPNGTDGDCWISADPRWSEAADLLEYSLAGLIYSQFDQQPERPLWIIGTDETPTMFLESSQNLGALSPDGNQGINCCLPRGETNLYLTDLATGDSLQLTNTPDRFNFNPQWWVENPETIVFLSTVVDPSDQPRPGPGNLAVVKTDGTDFQVLDAEHVTHSFLPALAPDGQTIAYNHGSETTYEDGILTPWLYHLEDGPSPFKYEDYGLSDLPGLSFGSAAWSPDGKYLAWVVGGDLTGDGKWKTGIAMFDLEGQSVEILAPHVPAGCLYAWCPEAPQWSPDGEWLTWYVSPAGGLPSFWIMQPDGNKKRLIDHAAGPIWSPDV